ncbi:MAG: hypothetical protein WAM60_23570, partial [Candidatus Promineifilaceae bacterium]
ERLGVMVTATNSVTGNRLRAELDYGDGGDVFEWQLFRPEEICELAAELGLELVLMCTEFDVRKRVTAEKPRMNFVFRKVV